jgi:hypothetical protein
MQSFATSGSFLWPLSQPYPWAAAVLVDEFDTGHF